MSRDMLSYEPGEMERFGFFSKERLRYIVLRCIQNRALRFSDGVIFLTRHAARVIQESCGQLIHFALIPHGVGAAFKDTSIIHPWPEKNRRPIKCLYVSNIALYKHQWHVVRAIAILRNKEFDLQLILAGYGIQLRHSSQAQEALSSEIKTSDPEYSFVRQPGFVPHQDLPPVLATSDLFVFASTCENMPNTLVEAMAVGLPIASSDRAPMREVLQDGGVYFDPEDPDSIADAIEKIICNADLRRVIATRARKLAEQYSWTRCADETFSYIAKIAKISGE
jgi:glycosyltransferase involved in cell wall biosynthesis